MKIILLLAALSLSLVLKAQPYHFTSFYCTQHTDTIAPLSGSIGIKNDFLFILVDSAEHVITWKISKVKQSKHTTIFQLTNPDDALFSGKATIEINDNFIFYRYRYFYGHPPNQKTMRDTVIFTRQKR